MRPYAHALKTFIEHPVPLRRVQVEDFAQPAFIVDPDGIIATWNDAAGEFFGLSAEDAIGKHCSDVVHATTLEGTPICEDDCPFLRHPSHSEPADEVIMRGPDASSVCAFLHHAPLEDAFGRFAGMLHTITPVAEHAASVKAAA